MNAYKLIQTNISKLKLLVKYKLETAYQKHLII